MRNMAATEGMDVGYIIQLIMILQKTPAQAHFGSAKLFSAASIIMSPLSTLGRAPGWSDRKSSGQL